MVKTMVSCKISLKPIQWIIIQMFDTWNDPFQGSGMAILPLRIEKLPQCMEVRAATCDNALRNDVPRSGREQWLRMMIHSI